METAIKTDIQPTLSENDKAFITRLAKRIQSSGFVTPAIFFLEMTKPLALLGSHAMVFFGPIINVSRVIRSITPKPIHQPVP